MDFIWLPLVDVLRNLFDDNIRKTYFSDAAMRIKTL